MCIKTRNLATFSYPKSFCIHFTRFFYQLNAIRGLTLLSLAAVLSNTAATVALPKSDIGSKKILVLLPLATPSHHNVFSALTDELLDRGHFLTIVSSRMQKRKHTRLTEVLINDPLEVFLRKYLVK